VPFPEPVPGLVIRYADLWSNEHARGQAEGVKDRPCAIVLVTSKQPGQRLVTVPPVTHSPPADPWFAVEVPAPTRRRLGPDDARSWVVLTEANRFVWFAALCAVRGDQVEVHCGTNVSAGSKR
jgi:hypothetical protein